MQGSLRLPAGFRSRLARGHFAFSELLQQVSSLWLRQFSRLRRDRRSRFGHRWLSCFAHGRLSRFSHSGLFRFDYDFNRSRQFRLGLLPSAMVALVQRLDAGGFFVRQQLSAFTVSALVLEVLRNRLCWHDRSVAELSSPKLSNCDHSVAISSVMPEIGWSLLTSTANEVRRLYERHKGREVNES